MSDEQKKAIEQAISSVTRGVDIESAMLILEKCVLDGLIITRGRINIFKIAVRQIVEFLKEYKDKGYLDVVREKVKANETVEKQSKEIEELKLKIGDEKTFIQLGECIGEKKVKDKIKAKIEELDKQEQDLQNSISDKEREEYSDASISWELMDIHARREVLKQLLDEVEIKDNKEIIKPLDPNEVYFKDGTELVYKLMYNKINELAMTVNKIMEEKK